MSNEISLVFYDVTTLYFETEQEDELRKTGFGKDGKHQHPQIVLGLLVRVGGYPLAYELFEGNKFEGHTMLPVIEIFKEKYKLMDLVVVADAGLMSGANIRELQSKGYRYSIGARIKNETKGVEKQILSARLKNGERIAIDKDKFDADAKWNGLKGYSTNTKLTQILQFNNLRHNVCLQPG